MRPPESSGIQPYAILIILCSSGEVCILLLKLKIFLFLMISCILIIMFWSHWIGCLDIIGQSNTGIHLLKSNPFHCLNKINTQFLNLCWGGVIILHYLYSHVCIQERKVLILHLPWFVIRPYFQTFVICIKWLINSLSTNLNLCPFPQYVEGGDEAAVRLMLGKPNTPEESIILQMCHPLCSCSKCRALLRQNPTEKTLVTAYTRDEHGYTGKLRSHKKLRTLIY